MCKGLTVKPPTWKNVKSRCLPWMTRTLLRSQLRHSDPVAVFWWPNFPSPWSLQRVLKGLDAQPVGETPRKVSNVFPCIYRSWLVSVILRKPQRYLVLKMVWPCFVRFFARGQTFKVTVPLRAEIQSAAFTPTRILMFQVLASHQWTHVSHDWLHTMYTYIKIYKRIYICITVLHLHWNWRQTYRIQITRADSPSSAFGPGPSRGVPSRWGRKWGWSAVGVPRPWPKEMWNQPRNPKWPYKWPYNMNNCCLLSQDV